MAPISASADDWGRHLQNRKNDWRNLALGAGAVGVIGLLNHNDTEAILGGVGAAYAGSQYENYRQQQSRRNDWRRNYYRRDYGYYGGGYGDYGPPYGHAYGHWRHHHHERD